MTASNKIQIRAQVLQAILKFKSSKIPSDTEVEECIKSIRKIEDRNFVVSLLLKEISGTNEIYDNILTLLLFNISSPKLLFESIFPILKDNSINDSKKLYLINILREQGQKVDYGFIQSHMKNPDEIIDRETKKFLDEAKISPETKIDFYDFYFTVNQNDREMLINSIISDYSGDGLANILAPFAYFYPEISIDEKIIQALFDTKSYFALEPLNWCANNCKDKELAHFAQKMYKKLSLLGFNTNIDKKEIYSELLKKSTPLGYWFSCADGNSNVSCVFARKKDKGGVQTFFTVFNLQNGPLSTFGFDEISAKDFAIVLLRFFKSSLSAKLPPDEGKLIFDTLSSRGWKNNTKIPYEFICWREITYDTKAREISFCDLLKENLKAETKSEKPIEKIIKSQLFSSWYYNCSDIEPLNELAQKIENENIVNIKQIEECLASIAQKLLQDEVFSSSFKEKLYYQCFILKRVNMENTANTLYGAALDYELLLNLLLHILKRSLYAHFAQKIPENNKNETVFTKRWSETCSYEFAKKITKILEKKWSQWI